MLNVVIVTQNEPFFIPKMLDTLIRQQGSVYRICGVTVLKPYRKNKSLFHWVKERFMVYSYWETFLAGMAFIYCSVNKLILRSGSHHSVKAIASKNELRLMDSEDINSVEYISSLKALEVDVIISISCPQLFKSEILNAPKITCINAHGTLLPRHRGVFGTWWTLFKNDAEAGSTIHTMELKLDAGTIVWQKSFRIESKDTQYSIAYKTKRDMAFGLVEVLKMYESRTAKVLAPVFESSYHRAPTRELGIEFHKMGKRVITLRDLKLMLSRTY